MFVHTVIKIQYTKQGYLPDWPPHLISDEEMCDAFLRIPDSAFDRDFCCFCCKVDDEDDSWYQDFLDDDRTMFFKDNYPLIGEEISDDYKNLVHKIMEELYNFKNNPDNDRKLPNWIYSYMLGAAIGPESDKLDIHDMISSMGVDNLEDEYNIICAKTCLEYSREWLKRVILNDADKRPPTMFGEPHVLKFLRLEQESLKV